MSVTNHIIKLKEHLDALEWAIKNGNQSSIGFHASQGAIEMVSIYLHKKHLVPQDIQIKHTWFRSEKAIKEKLNFDFPHKGKIIELIKEIEDLRDPLCYGTPREEEAIEMIMENFNSLKMLIEKELGDMHD